MFAFIISDIRYKKKEVFFTIGQNIGETFPKVSLQASPTALLSSIEYFGLVTKDFVFLTGEYIKTLSVSTRFFQLISISVTVILVFMTFIAFSEKIHVPIYSLFSHVYHHSLFQFNKPNQYEAIKGTVLDKNKAPLLDVNIYLLNPKTNIVIAHTNTNDDGMFSFFKLPNSLLKLVFVKDDFHPYTFYENISEYDYKEGIRIELGKEKKEFSIFTRTVSVFKHTVALNFEAFLLISLILEFGIGYYISWGKALPLIIISVINIVLWIFHENTTKNRMA